MNNYEVIIISGAQGSGKTTAVESLLESLSNQGFRAYNLIFADTIYKIHDYALSLLESRGVKRDIKKDGTLLQMLGTEWGRNTIDSDIWVKCLQGQIDNILKDNPGDKLFFLISDCRFRNEFDGFPDAFSVRLEAPREVRKERCSQWRENDTHPSEIDLNGYAREGKFNCYIDTEKDKEDTIKKIFSASAIWEENRSAKGIGFEEMKAKYYHILDLPEFFD